MVGSRDPPPMSSLTVSGPPPVSLLPGMGGGRSMFSWQVRGCQMARGRSEKVGFGLDVMVVGYVFQWFEAGQGYMGYIGY